MSDIATTKDDRMVEVLTEILKWIKVTSIPNVRKLLEDTLDTDKAKLAFHYSDGRSSREVSKVSGYTHSTVTSSWKKWFRIGIVEPVGVQRGDRYKKLFALEDFGIKVSGVESEATSEAEVQAGGEPGQ